MKKIIVLCLFALFFCPTLLQAQQKEWLTLGQNDYTEIDGYTTLYRLKLQVPKGVHDAYDIRQGIQIMRFRLVWLPPVTSQKDIQSHFKKLLAAQFESEEDLKFNQTILNRLYSKLPEAKRHDEWVFEYSPEAGTSLIIENKKIHTVIGSEANTAIHQAWLHESPVVTSKLMKRLLQAKH